MLYTGRQYIGRVPLKLFRNVEENVESKDERFRFFHWNVHNVLYNPQAPRMSTREALPVEGSYDVIMGFSLFTHLAPQDASEMLKLMRKTVCPDGFLFFSEFCDKSVDTFEDRVREEPLLHAYYEKSYLEGLIEAEGWKIVSYDRPRPFIMSSFLCRPLRRSRPRK